MDRRNFLALGGVAAVASSGLAMSAATASSDKLITRRIPSSDEAIPAIGLGTSGPFEVGNGERDRAPLREVLEAFFAGGATLIDTSPMYSTAEDVLGDLLTANQQSKAFIATKVWTPGTGIHGEQKGIEQMQRSISLLKHKPIDLMQVHNLVDLDVHLKTLRRWKDEGKVRYIGVTHYTTTSYPDLISIIQREKLDFVQFNYSVTTREAEKRLLPLCADKGVAVLVNRAFDADFGARSWAQVFLKFVLAHPAVTCVIPATGKLRNLVDNLGAGMGALPDAKQRAQIVAAFS
jgi:aryl-alcohol dehydrogenase-like predicted oxidoreductase